MVLFVYRTSLMSWHGSHLSSCCIHPAPASSQCMRVMHIGSAGYATPRRRFCGSSSSAGLLSHLLTTLRRRLRSGGSGAPGALWSYVGGASFRPSLRSQEVPLKWSSTALLTSARLILSARFCLHTTSDL